MDGFSLDERLAQDTIAVGDLDLCSVRLVDDARFPWIVLVPRRPGLAEVTDLEPADCALLTSEIRIAARVMSDLSKPDTINVGVIGNVIAQLHLHVVGRFRSDPAWPGSVWGFGTRASYPHHAATLLVDRAAHLFSQA